MLQFSPPCSKEHGCHIVPHSDRAKQRKFPIIWTERTLRRKATERVWLTKKKKKDCGRTIQRGLSFYIGLLSFLNWCKGISRGGGVFACLQRWKGITRQRQNQIRSQKCIKKKIKGQSLWRCDTFWNIRQLHQIMPITIGDFRVSKCISILQVVQVSLPLDV